MSNHSDSVSRHLEVERKFDVAASTRTPSFDGLPPVAGADQCPPVTLDAVYFDTPGHDLATHRITLRRRTGGGDAGWHLKLPAGPDARTEVRMPPGGDEVPEELRDIVLAIVRDRPLEPIARITTDRTVEVLRAADGTALAEFCDDQVTASANGETGEQRWREWELELTGDAHGAGIAGGVLLKRLSSRLRDTGAKPGGSASKLARALGPLDTAARPAAGRDDSVHHAVAEQFQQLLVWDRAVRADAEDSVHQMRVTLRTLRSLLQASGPAFGLPAAAPILGELREMAAVLGVARDAEVLVDRYRRALGELPGPLVRGPVRERLVDGARQQYRFGLRQSLSAMRSQRYFRLLDTLQTLVTAEPPAPPAQEKRADRATIEAGYRRVRRQVRAVAAAEPQDHDAALHNLRKSAKRMRYTAAAARAHEVALAAKAVQTVLGDHHDSVVSRAHLLVQADTAHRAGEDTFTYGLLHEREADLAQRCEQQLDSALHVLGKAVHSALHADR